MDNFKESADAFEKLKSEYINLEAEYFKKSADAFEKLKNGYALIREDNKRKAWDFNIFRLLKVERYEVYTNSSMLKDLLDSHGTHGQGNLFFKEFLSMLAGKKVIAEYDINLYSDDYYFCATEKPIETGRVDIILQRLDGKFPFCFIIENKIDAGDQENQIGRYWQEIEKLDAAVRKKIFYLTPDGSQATEIAIKKKEREYLEKNGFLHCLSYKKDIESWLDNSFEKVESEKVKYTVMQYLDIVKNL